MGPNPPAVTWFLDIALAPSKEFLDVQATSESRLTQYKYVTWQKHKNTQTRP